MGWFQQTFRLADLGRRLFVPGRASRLGYPRHLLFEFAVGRRAHWAGGGAFAAFAIWALWFSRQRRMFMLAVVLFFEVVPKG